eukprot:1159094-Pelagomonas_calceolata.AAC.4
MKVCTAALYMTFRESHAPHADMQGQLCAPYRPAGTAMRPMHDMQGQPCRPDTHLCPLVGPLSPGSSVQASSQQSGPSQHHAGAAAAVARLQAKEAGGYASMSMPLARPLSRLFGSFNKALSCWRCMRSPYT